MKTKINRMPKEIICEGTLFTLGAIDQNYDGYYLSANGGFIRANDLYVGDELCDENGIPHYEEYAVYGLYFEYNCIDGEVSEYVRKMLCSRKCIVLTKQMQDFITALKKDMSDYTEFENDLEIGWDYAVTELCKKSKHKDIAVLNDIYWLGYKTTAYQDDLDPDSGLCYEIRSFAIQKILEVLQNGN